MDKKYVQLFTEVVHAAEILAEQVMKFNHDKKDQKGEETAKIMRDDYSALYDKIRAENFSPDNLTKEEYTKMLVAVMIIVENIQNRIHSENKAIEGYRIDVIPKLQRIVNETKNNEAAQSLAKELFQISDN